MTLTPPPPGPQTPGKYPVPVGNRYKQYGEQPGWIYNPWTDKYVPDPKMQQQYAESQGLVEKKPKSVGPWGTVAPMAAVAMAPTIGKHVIAPALKEVPGLIGLGENAQTVAQTTQALNTADTAVNAVNAGATAVDAGVTAGQAGGLISVGEAGGEAASAALATEGTQAAWNAGANAATDAAAAGTSTMGYAVPIAGAALGTYGVINAFEHGGGGWGGAGQGALSGAAAGASIGSIIPGVGTVIGGAVGAVVGGVMGFLGTKTTKQIQAERENGLAEKDSGFANFINIARSNRGAEKAAYDAAPEGFKGIDSNGIWVNKKFMESRDEADLAPEDTWGSPDVVEIAGPDYFGKWTDQQRRDYNQKLIDGGLIREKKGGIYVTDRTKAEEIRAQVAGSAAPASTPAPATQQPQKVYHPSTGHYS